MARLFRCDQCGYSQETVLPFELNQRLDEVDADADGDTVVVEFDLCGAACLSDFAMGLSLDFPEGDT